MRRTAALATLLLPVLAVDAFAPLATSSMARRRTSQSSGCAINSLSAAVDGVAKESTVLSEAKEVARAAVEASLAEGRAEEEAAQKAASTKLSEDSAAATDLLRSEEIPEDATPTLAASKPHDVDPKIWKLIEEARSMESTRVLIRAEEDARSAVAASLAETAARLSDSDRDSSMHLGRAAGLPDSGTNCDKQDSANDKRDSNLVTLPDSQAEPVASSEFPSASTPSPSSSLDPVTPTVALSSTTSSATLRKAEKAAQLQVAAFAAAEAAASLQGRAARAKCNAPEAIAPLEGKLLGSR